VRESAEELRVRLVRARWVRRLPGFGVALEAGQITAGHVDVLAVVLDRVEPTVVAEVVADEAEVLEVASTGSRSSFGRWLRLRVDRVRADGGRRRLERQVAESFGSLRVDDELGLHRLFVQLDPLRGGRVAAAVRRRVEELQRSGVVEGWRRGQVIAQAVTDLVCGDVSAGSGGAEVVVIADLVTLLEGHHEGSVCETDDGLAVPVGTVRDLCRQAATALTVAVRDPAGITIAVGRHGPPTPKRPPGPPGPAGSTSAPGAPPDAPAHCSRERPPPGLGPDTGDLAQLVAGALGRASPDGLDLGRRIRLANRSQRRALRAMYRGCAHPDCRVPFVDCAIHHVTPWESGGATDLANLLPLCSSHHHLVHEGGWRLTTDPARTLRSHRPGGRLDTTTPFRPLGATATALGPVGHTERPPAPPVRGSPPRRAGGGGQEDDECRLFDPTAA